ncbi:MAG: hypothetical protein SFZ24_02370 [Planctomycetota bacterium]|nr:hypothetical protein [Planctomycetota bacterium]
MQREKVRQAGTVAPTAFRLESDLPGLPVGQPVTSPNELVSIEHTEPDPRQRRQFDVFFGGLDLQGKDDTLSGPLLKGEGALRNADPEWQVVSGFAMIRGWRPRSRTNRVTTASNGTMFFVQIDRSGTDTDEADDVHRIALLELTDPSHPLNFYLRQGAPDGPPDDITGRNPDFTLKDQRTFVEVVMRDGSIKFDGPYNLDDPADPDAVELATLVKAKSESKLGRLLQ